MSKHIHPRHAKRKTRQPKRIQRLLFIAKQRGKLSCLSKTIIRLRLLLRSIIMIHDSPHAIALGIVIGMIVGFSPTVGLQMILAAIIATLLGANRLTAIIPVWITNPITIPPIYAFTYYLGGFVTPGQNQIDIYAKLQQVVIDIENYTTSDTTSSAFITFFTTMWGKFKIILDLGGDVVIQMFLGGFILGGLIAAISYPLTLWLLSKSKRFNNRQKILAQIYTKKKQAA